jgi:hypothetical protein
MDDRNAICVQRFARGAESAILRLLHAVCFSGDVAWQVQSGARYPSGLRERSAKPPFVGSNPTRASRFSFLRKVFMPIGAVVRGFSVFLSRCQNHIIGLSVIRSDWFGAMVMCVAESAFFSKKSGTLK